MTGKDIRWPQPQRQATLPTIRQHRRRRAVVSGSRTSAVALIATALAVIVPELINLLTSGKLALPDVLAPWRLVLVVILTGIGAALVEYRAGHTPPTPPPTPTPPLARQSIPYGDEHDQ